MYVDNGYFSAFRQSHYYARLLIEALELAEATSLNEAAIASHQDAVVDALYRSACFLSCVVLSEEQAKALLDSPSTLVNVIESAINDSPSAALLLIQQAMTPSASQPPLNELLVEFRQLWARPVSATPSHRVAEGLIQSTTTQVNRSVDSWRWHRYLEELAGLVTDSLVES